jgi:hypothetical protein
MQLVWPSLTFYYSCAYLPSFFQKCKIDLRFSWKIPNSSGKNRNFNKKVNKIVHLTQDTLPRWYTTKWNHKISSFDQWHMILCYENLEHQITVRALSLLNCCKAELRRPITFHKSETFIIKKIVERELFEKVHFLAQDIMVPHCAFWTRTLTPSWGLMSDPPYLSISVSHPPYLSISMSHPYSWLIKHPQHAIV